MALLDGGNEQRRFASQVRGALDLSAFEFPVGLGQKGFGVAKGSAVSRVQVSVLELSQALPGAFLAGDEFAALRRQGLTRLVRLEGRNFRSR